MNHRRLIGTILALALLAGSTFVPLARAACALPKAKAACSSCVNGPTSSSTALTTDRSCCAAPASLAEREPATISSDRNGDHRTTAAAVLVSAAHVPALVVLVRPHRHLAGAPGVSPPHTRTTILLI